MSQPMESAGSVQNTAEVPQTPQPVVQAAAEAAKNADFKASPAPDISGQNSAEPAPYTPNYKFKVLDKEMEIEEFMRGVIKDADSEKKVRELYEKAHGLDFVKKERDRIRQESQSYRQKTDPLMEEIKELGTFLREKDLDKFFSKFNLPEDTIVNWVADKLRYKQMTPEQRSQIDTQRQLKDRVYEQEQALQGSSSALDQMRIEQTQFTIQQFQNDPEIKRMAEVFDSQAGQQGYFWDRALAWADYKCVEEGKFVPFHEAFADFKKNFFLGQHPAPEAQAAPPPPQTKPVVTAPPEAKPTIKNFPSSAQSPVRSKVRSIEDLQKKYNEMAGRPIEPGRR